MAPWWRWDLRFCCLKDDVGERLDPLRDIREQVWLLGKVGVDPSDDTLATVDVGPQQMPVELSALCVFRTGLLGAKRPRS